MSKTDRIERGHYITPDGRFEIRRDDKKGQWFVEAKDADASSALRATAHLRGYPRLHDAESWIHGTVYPHLREQAKD